MRAAVLPAGRWRPGAVPGADAGWLAGLVRVRPRKLCCHWPERRGRHPIRSASVSTFLGWRRPRKFEMADGLLAAGELGSEAMGPGPERTGWAAEEKGECPPGRPGEPPAARGPGGGGGCASPRRQSREASWATPVLSAPSDLGVLGSGGRWTGPGILAPVSAWASGARGSAASQGSEEVVTALPFPREGTGAWLG